MSKREPRLLVSDILESAQKILDYTAGLNYEAFIEDGKTVDAVIRNFEIIGEAANRLPEAFKERLFRYRFFHCLDHQETFLPQLIGQLHLLLEI